MPAQSSPICRSRKYLPARSTATKQQPLRCFGWYQFAAPRYRSRGRRGRTSEREAPHQPHDLGRLGGRRRGEALEPGGGEQQLDRVRLRGQPELDLSRGVETRGPWLTVACNAAIWWIPRCIYDNRSHFWYRSLRQTCDAPPRLRIRVVTSVFDSAEASTRFSSRSCAASQTSSRIWIRPKQLSALQCGGE